MLVKLLPSQVPTMWEAIKFASAKASILKESELPKYFNKLLHDLLSGKAQVFAKLTDERRLTGIIITKLLVDNLTDERVLEVENLYSFEPVSKESWMEGLHIIGKFAVSTGCVKITTYTTSEKVYEILKMMGFRERFRSFSREVQ